MLLTDSDIITAADLAVIDPESARVASSEQPPITLEGPASIIRHTLDEAGNQLASKFQNFSGYLVSPGINLNHVAAVMNILSTAINRPRFRINQVVVVPPDPTKTTLHHWLEHSALAQLYQAAFARFTGKNLDRYERKMEFYQDKTDFTWRQLLSQGIPIVLQPLPCPGAIREFGAGAFATGAVTATGSGSGDPGSTYYVRITWVGSAYVNSSNKGNAESAGSAQLPIAVPSGEYIAVSIAALNPPSLTLPPVGTADNIYNQLNATGWNIYVGTDPAGPLWLQNASPIPVATTSYTLSVQPVLSGSQLTVGQFPDYNFAFQNMLFRG